MFLRRYTYYSPGGVAFFEHGIVIFVGSNYLTQGELYRLGLLTTGFRLLTFLALGTPWLLFVAR